jgi:hypothetical protein
MKKVIILSVIFTSLFIAEAFAQTSIKAEVDKAIVTTDDAITYKLIITSSEKSIPKPQLSKFTGFKIISSAQSSTVSFTKGNVKTIAVYAFVLVPADKGTLKIEPSSIKIKNETYSTATLEIEVKQGKLKPKTELGQRPSMSEETQPETEQPPQIIL